MLSFIGDLLEAVLGVFLLVWTLAWWVVVIIAPFALIGLLL